MADTMSTTASAELFVSGALCAGFLVAGLFFLRFWIRTRDTLFAAFAAAFVLMAANQAVAAFAHVARGEDARAYLLRLVAFVLVIVAVLGKNASEDRSKRE
jgi:hypothetical protein